MTLQFKKRFLVIQFIPKLILTKPSFRRITNDPGTLFVLLCFGISAVLIRTGEVEA